MDSFSHYWQLAKITSSGHYYCKPLPKVETWFRYCFLNALNDTSERYIQDTLVERWQAGGPDAAMAQLSLRCWVSHHIYSTCRQLAQQFGQHYGFHTTDLLPHVLDDNGRLLNAYRPFTLEILETYCPTKAKLSTWTVHLTKNHRSLNDFLLEQGLYRISNWAILNDTTSAQLDHIFQSFYQFPLAERQAAQALLERYHQVYRHDRRLALKTRRSQGIRCQCPTSDQLRQIATGHQSPAQVLVQLEEMATQLRQYRIYKRSGYMQTLGNMVSLDELDNFAIDYYVSTVNGPESDEADEQQTFFQQYQSHLESCLQQAIYQALQQQVDRLQRRSGIKAQAYLEAVRLFHQEGLSMGAISTRLTQQFSPALSFNNQVQITRLLRLKELRTQIHQITLDNIKTFVYEAAGQLTSAQRLTELKPAIETILTQTIDQIIGEAAAEAQSPQRHQPASRLAITLCEVVDSLAAA
ncbi:hypothetical protein [Leptothoe sp. PORK10 BA2]|uniref:hypothetical protein n=1 Tax=Leptothoe sp. PORK10 BA2 TaxID=3110254 RepID=UPI002B1ED472|nr:hypothetical protein [Leptothoe sp. PORK10 BA2]MEA5463533.1 hypothetical protein [Leptothoe sp. PORK10 BA2]